MLHVGGNITTPPRVNSKLSVSKTGRVHADRHRATRLDINITYIREHPSRWVSLYERKTVHPVHCVRHLPWLWGKSSGLKITPGGVSSYHPCDILSPVCYIVTCVPLCAETQRSFTCSMWERSGLHISGESGCNPLRTVVPFGEQTTQTLEHFVPKTGLRP